MMQAGAPSQGFASATVFIAASVWGLYWLPLRHVEDLGLAGGWAVAMVNVPALIVLLPVVLWSWHACRDHLMRIVLIGALTGAALALYASGLVHSSVVRATLLFYLTPVWATLIGLVWLGERASWSRWAAIGLGLIGLVLLVSGGESSIPLNIGDLFAVISGMFWAMGAAMIMRYPEIPVQGTMTGMFTFTGIVAISIGHLFGGDILPSAQALGDARDQGVKSLCLLIGGPDGHGPAAQTLGARKIAFGKAPWPHLLVRVMAAEQVYRAVSILVGAPYHRD